MRRSRRARRGRGCGDGPVERREPSRSRSGEPPSCDTSGACTVPLVPPRLSVPTGALSDARALPMQRARRVAVLDPLRRSVARRVVAVDAPPRRRRHSGLLARRRRPSQPRQQLSRAHSTRPAASLARAVEHRPLRAAARRAKSGAAAARPPALGALQGRPCSRRLGRIGVAAKGPPLVQQVRPSSMKVFSVRDAHTSSHAASPSSRSSPTCPLPTRPRPPSTSTTTSSCIVCVYTPP